jgi:hypothetical protein
VNVQGDVLLLETHLQLVLEQVLLVRELAVEAEQLGLIRRHFLCEIVRSGLLTLAAAHPPQHLGTRGTCAGAANDVR